MVAEDDGVQLEGVAVGGEWGGAVLLAAEHAPKGRKTFFASFAQLGSPAGLILSLLAWNLGKAGVWVILSGALRYAFVAAGWLLPFLERPLPPSERRRIVCVVQVATLIACLLPVLPPALTSPLAAVGLVATAWSFAVDVRWLWGNRA